MSPHWEIQPSKTSTRNSSASPAESRGLKDSASSPSSTRSCTSHGPTQTPKLGKGREVWFQYGTSTYWFGDGSKLMCSMFAIFFLGINIRFTSYSGYSTWGARVLTHSRFKRARICWKLVPCCSRILHKLWFPYPIMAGLSFSFHARLFMLFPLSIIHFFGLGTTS